ncbi:MAG TPA: CsgG/HfaB family protein [Longimicrobium sp.]|nr:CsgG/HfaB family protein [Longimicrobium sp.]
MPKSILLLALSACLPACASAPAPPAAAVAPAQPPARPAAAPAARVPVQERPGIAVLPFTNGGSFGRDREDLAAMEVGIQQMLLTELQQNPALRVVERAAIREMLNEQDLGTAGRLDPATAARVGKLVGARYAVMGVFMDLYGDFRLDGRIVNVETSETVRAVSIRGQRRENLYAMLVQMAGQIMEGVRLPPLPAAAVQERRARNVPDEATAMYSRAVFNAENGRTAQAIELYRQIVQRFPDYTEAREELRQLEEG